jgi:ribosomal protein S15P/S13E
MVKRKSKKSSKIAEKKKISKAEFEKRVIELAKKGHTGEKIGEILRQEGIHPKEHDIKISKILKEKDLYVNPDLKNIEEKLNRVKRHYEKNKQDRRAVREKDRIAAKLRKIKKYFKK